MKQKIILTILLLTILSLSLFVSAIESTSDFGSSPERESSPEIQKKITCNFIDSENREVKCTLVAEEKCNEPYDRCDGLKECPPCVPLEILGECSGINSCEIDFEQTDKDSYVKYTLKTDCSSHTYGFDKDSIMTSISENDRVELDCKAGREQDLGLGETIVCKDSDEGFNIYKKGKIECKNIETGEVLATSEDKCQVMAGDNNDIRLLEMFLSSSFGSGGAYTVKCKYGCLDGACINKDGSSEKMPICTDTDGGDNIFVKGQVEGFYYGGKGAQDEETIFQKKSFEDECSTKEENSITEYYCMNGAIKSETISCEDGICSDGVCISDCSGCEKNGNCYNYGEILDGEYCSGRGSFSSLKENGILCINNFECGSGICENICVSKNLFQKIVDWLRNIF